MTFILKTYDVQVQGFGQTYPYLASSPAKARVQAWHAYCSYRAISFREFLSISTIRRGVDAPGIGRPITVGGLPAHWCGFNGQYVRFCRPDEDQTFFSHPNDVAEVAA